MLMEFQRLLVSSQFAVSLSQIVKENGPLLRNDGKVSFLDDANCFAKVTLRFGVAAKDRKKNLIVEELCRQTTWS